MSSNDRRFSQLYQAALNLGMSKNDARHYATEALHKDLEIDESDPRDVFPSNSSIGLGQDGH